MAKDRQIEEIAADLYKKAGQPGVFTARGAERRQHRRTPLAGELHAIAHRESGPAVKVRVRDVSRAGVGMMCDDAIRRGEQFAMDVNFGRGMLKLKCRVANCRLGPDDKYIIGAEFVAIARHKASASLDSMDDSAPPDTKHLQDVEARLNQLLNDANSESTSSDRRS